MSKPQISLDDLQANVGKNVGESQWRTVDQQRIDGFAELTEDPQWIHTDPARAADGPFGGTIAHGYLTLSLIPVLTWELLAVAGTSMTVNYGLNRVRFPSPVPVGTAVRASMTLRELSDVAGGLQSVTEVTVERDGGTKPVCVAETVARYYR